MVSTEELIEACIDVIDSGYYIRGNQSAIEEAFALFCGVEHCVGVGNGLDALSLVLRVEGVRENSGWR